MSTRKNKTLITKVTLPAEVINEENMAVPTVWTENTQSEKDANAERDKITRCFDQNFWVFRRNMIPEVQKLCKESFTRGTQCHKKLKVDLEQAQAEVTRVNTNWAAEMNLANNLRAELETVKAQRDRCLQENMEMATRLDVCERELGVEQATVKKLTEDLNSARAKWAEIEAFFNKK